MTLGYRFALASMVILTPACGTDQPVTGPTLAKGPAGSQFSAAPGALEFSVPPGGSALVTVTAQYLTTVTSVSSDTDCATVTPASVPTRKPKSSSVYTATFTVVAEGEGTCVVTLTDKNGKTATVEVSVLPPLPDRIVYASDQYGAWDVFIMDLDGANKTRLTTTTDLYEFFPSLSADGRRIVFVETDEANTTRVNWIMSPDGSGRSELPSAMWGPSLSPDRTRVAFTREVDGYLRVFTADLNGANEVQLTSGTGAPHESAPWWSGPWPGRIVFLRESPRGIWIMNLDGTGQTLLTDEWLHQSPSGASLSPDGQWVVYDCQPSAHVFDICKVKVDGTSRTQLTTATGDDTGPRWTRDGRIVFTSERDGNQEIYLMNADGTGPVNLTNSSANESTRYPRP